VACLAGIFVTTASVGCGETLAPSQLPPLPGPQTVVLFATPKIITDFGSPQSDVARFLDHYSPLTSQATETVVIFGVGNSEHIQTFVVGASMNEDDHEYASAPNGIEAGTLCGHFLADQAALYLRDLGFDGILYGNQLGTRGHWLPQNGPGYSVRESDAIRDFLEHSRRALGELGLMWFDSYNNVDVERDSFSFPSDGYDFFDYIIAAGFCVITTSDRYLDNLKSKLQLGDEDTRALATLDDVDPWYPYDSMIDFPEESGRLEDIAIQYRNEIDGLIFFANDEVGRLVPRIYIESFVDRFFLQTEPAP
jgi:hypothetical protein